jgi:hypothetical protein
MKSSHELNIVGMLAQDNTHTYTQNALTQNTYTRNINTYT